MTWHWKTQTQLITQNIHTEQKKKKEEARPLLKVKSPKMTILCDKRSKTRTFVEQLKQHWHIFPLSMGQKIISMFVTLRQSSMVLCQQNNGYGVDLIFDRGNIFVSTKYNPELFELHK